MPEEKPTQTVFGREMERRRIAVGYKQASAARVAGISPSRWGQLELGYQPLGEDSEGVKRYKTSHPSREMVVKISKALKWDRADALRTAGYDPEPEPSDEPVKLPPSMLIDDWNRLTPQQQRGMWIIMQLFLNGEAPVDVIAPYTKSPLFSDASAGSVTDL